VLINPLFVRIQPGEPMKSIIIALTLTVLAALANARADDNGGSNISGNEKVCYIGPNAPGEPTLADVLKNCRRGDILDTSWLQHPVALQLCDFTKAVLYHPTKGSAIACVYIGTRRPVSK
jgi:hypothetical protein